MGVKYDRGKPRPTLILGSMSNAIAAVIEIAEHGAVKYEVDGWMSVPDGQKRYTDATLRHLLADVGGEERDPDSGLLHAAHAAWGALARLELKIRAGACAAQVPDSSEPAEEDLMIRPGFKLEVEFPDCTRVFHFQTEVQQSKASQLAEANGWPQVVHTTAQPMPRGLPYDSCTKFAMLADTFGI